jgi:hypothetical protein
MRSAFSTANEAMNAQPGETAAAGTLEALQKLWYVFFWQSLIFWLALVMMTGLLEVTPLAPELGAITFGAGLFLIAPALYVRGRYRALLAAPRWRQEARAWDELRRWFFIGLGIADAPALLGFGHFLLTGDGDALTLLAITTCVLVYLFRPSAR